MEYNRHNTLSKCYVKLSFFANGSVYDWKWQHKLSVTSMDAEFGGGGGGRPIS